jgi:uncharacterized membrane protein YfcA
MPSATGREGALTCNTGIGWRPGRGDGVHRLVSGTLAGLLGVGGGIVIVPVLFYVLPLFDVPEASQMKVAVATSLATIIPTSIVSARKHRAKGAMDMGVLRALAPSMFLGVLLGTGLSVVVGGQALVAVFGVVGLLVR